MDAFVPNAFTHAFAHANARIRAGRGCKSNTPQDRLTDERTGTTHCH
jgi:hypothetical protein